MKAHIQIVGWNHYHYIGTCILSCQKQTVSVPIVYVDNDSKDESVAYIKKNYSDIILIENKENRGYAGGHNDGINKIADSEIVICLNPDVVLEEDFVEKVLQKFETAEKVGVVVPLLFRDKQRDKNGKMRIVVDSYGTKLKNNLNVENILEGVYWDEAVAGDGKTPMGSDPNALPSPWGFTGAAVAFSRSAIDDLKDEAGDFFDEDLHSYREDVDVSWRFNRRGWTIVGAPEARAWHARAARKGEKKSMNVVRLSWRNYFLVTIKDVPAESMKRNFIPFGIQILARIGQFVVSPSLWGGLPVLVKLVPMFINKRRKVLHN